MSKKKFEDSLNIVGLLLLAGCFIIALLQVFNREVAENDPEVTHISIAHWQLEAGLREAIDVVGKRFEEIKRDEAIAECQGKLSASDLDPKERKTLEKRLKRLEGGDLWPVKIKQIPVPDKVYTAWQKTRLVGGMAPTIMAHTRLPESMIGQYFLPLSEVIEQPNPYNEGSHQAGISWRNTFIGELRKAGFKEQLMDNYGIPWSMFSIRMFANRELIQEVLADPDNAALAKRLKDKDGKPQDYDDFIDLCDAITALGEKKGEPIVPIAGSSYNTPLLMGSLFIAGTQTYNVQYDIRGDNSYHEDDVAFRILEGSLNLEDEDFRRAYGLLRDVGRHLKPGSVQLKRDDAMFSFVQGQAAMIATGSWDAPSLHLQTDGLFELDVFDLPTPARDHPRFGGAILGPNSESDNEPGMIFSVVNYHSQHEIDLAIEFMQYATSLEGNTLFANSSNWLPANVDVTPPEMMQPFKVQTNGYPRGTIASIVRQEGDRVFKNQLHLLLKPDGSVDDFLQSAKEPLHAAILTELKKGIRNREKLLERQDTMLASWAMMAAKEGESADKSWRKFGRLLDAQAALASLNDYNTNRMKAIEAK